MRAAGIEGYVIEVMESMPLQLIVKSNSTRVFVGLQPETTVTQRGRRLDWKALREGMYVRIEGTGSMRDSIIADSIEIRD